MPPKSKTQNSKSQLLALQYPESESHARSRHASAYFNRLSAAIGRRFDTRFGRSWLRKFRRNPAAFAFAVLGSNWWSMQTRIARAVADNRRVAVRSANGVGKTYLAADLVLWFLYTHQPAIVLTTAPTWRQVRHLLWEEIRRRWTAANNALPIWAEKLERKGLPGAGSSSTSNPALSPSHSSNPSYLPTKARHTLLPGKLHKTRLDAGPAWFALGLSSDSAVRFQGFHAENLLVVLDEASGVSDEIWDAAEAIALGQNNKVLAIGNPLVACGRFYQKFRDNSGWKCLTISALNHPNIHRKAPEIPGCITEAFFEDRLNDWCDELESNSNSNSNSAVAFDGLSPPSVQGGASQSRAGPQPEIGNWKSEIATPHPHVAQPDVIVWKGKRYRPNNLFRARLLGEFPNADDESLIPLRWIEAAIDRPLQAHGYRRMAVDVAHHGASESVIGLRIGPVLVLMEPYRDIDTMEVADMIERLAYQHRPEYIAVDNNGVGAGVVDRLIQKGLEGVEPVMVSRKAHDPDRFKNHRAELYWGLRERFRDGNISIVNDRLLVEQLANIRYRITSQGTIQIEFKEDMRKRGLASPDRADMLALIYDGPADYLFGQPIQPLPPSPAAKMKQEMQGW